MIGARRLDGIQQSVIREMTRLAYRHGAVNLAQGFPEFDPPPAMLDAAVAALRGGRNQYSITWGQPELRRALAEKYARFYGMDADPEREITVTCGVTEAVIAALLGLVDPGDRVVVLEPAHENYAPGIRWAGGDPLWVPLPPPDFALDRERLRAAFADNPRVILLNTPQNPSGRVLSREELQLIADLCRAHDTIAITDEIYEHILYDDRIHIPLATLPGMAERTVTISGLSKSYAATGWRIGWIVAPAPLSEAIRTVHDYLTICAPTPLQAAATVAAGLDDDYYDRLRETYHACRARTVDMLTSAGFRVSPPEGAYYVLADFTAIRSDLDDVAFTRWLVENHALAVVPGSSFYHDKELARHTVRFAFPKRAETLVVVEQALLGLRGGRDARRA